MKKLVLFIILIFSSAIFTTIEAQKLPRRIIESDELINLTQDLRLLVQESIFYFKKIDPRLGVVEFTYEDALAVEKYFLSQPSVLRVESDPFNKKFIVTSKKISETPKIKIRDCSLALEASGYVSTGARSNTTFKWFYPKIAKKCEALNKKTTQSEAAQHSDDCEDCERDRINQKFKNMGYGGDVLIYDINAIPASSIKDPATPQEAGPQPEQAYPAIHPPSVEEVPLPEMPGEGVKGANPATSTETLEQPMPSPKDLPMDEMANPDVSIEKLTPVDAKEVSKEAVEEMKSEMSRKEKRKEKRKKKKKDQEDEEMK